MMRLMKCSKCGVENPNDAENCANCGIKFGKRVIEEGLIKPEKKTWNPPTIILKALIVVVMVVGILITAAVFLNEKEQQTATILVGVENYHGALFGTVHYVVALNGNQYSQGNLSNGESQIILVHASFPQGPTTAQEIITVTFTEQGYSPDSQTKTVTVSNMNDYPLLFTYK